MLAFLFLYIYFFNPCRKEVWLLFLETENEEMGGYCYILCMCWED